MSMKTPADYSDQSAFHAEEYFDTQLHRRTERINGPWVAQVRGRDASGQKFTESTVLENVSAGGLYVNLRHAVCRGASLLVVFTFSTEALYDVPVPKVAARGNVRRIEQHTDGNVYGVGIKFQHHRFL